MLELRGPQLREFSVHVRTGAGLAAWGRPGCSSPLPWARALYSSSQRETVGYFFNARSLMPLPEEGAGFIPCCCGGGGQLPHCLPAASGQAKLIGTPGRCREVAGRTVQGPQGQ